MKRLMRVFACGAIVFFGCEKSRKPSPVVLTADYLALQQAAERFTPAIGGYGGELVLPLLSEPSSLNPLTATDPAAAELTRHMYEGLVRIDGVTLKPRPGLAQSWDMSPDGLSWTFHIRQGLQWSDGAAFSADDVEFTFNSLVLNDSINPNPSRDLFIIDGVKPVIKVMDSLTIRFTLAAPHAPFPRKMSQEILPRHKLLRSMQRGMFFAALRLQTPPDSFVGMGPFMPELVVPSQKIIFKRNPLYWQKDSAGNRLPYLDRIVYMKVPNHGAEVQRFKRGELDYLMAAGDDCAGLEKDSAKGHYTIHRIGPATGSSFLIFNQNSGVEKISGKSYGDSVKLSWFRNTAFRKAVAYGLDKQTMLRTAMNGMGFPQWSPMSPADGFFYNPDVARYDYDTAKAKEVLRSAGFSFRADGACVDAGGHPVDFSFATSGGNVMRAKIADAVRRNLEQLGFKVHFQVMNFSDLVQKIDNPPYDWDAAFLGLSGGVEPHYGLKVWRSSGEMHMWFPNQKTPATPWEASIDSIFDAAARELDESKRKALYDRWQRIAAEQLPLIATVLPERIVCIAGKFKNVNPCVTSGLLHSMERLYVQQVK
jgi:peptide/nickel transport system substrate-binding protein